MARPRAENEKAAKDRNLRKVRSRRQRERDFLICSIMAVDENKY
jgi:hypothetical protein